MSFSLVQRKIRFAYTILGKLLLLPRKNERNLISKLTIWMPSSANADLYPDITINNANAYPRLLMKLAKSATDSSQDIPMQTTAKKGLLNIELTQRLSKLFRQYGSDKSAAHDYHKIYADFLHTLGIENMLNILEIGLGTNNAFHISSMGTNGKPGASVRAFRDALPNARIYGADIDKNILFTENRIATAYVDQLDPSSFNSMTIELGIKHFDLIIDDGLHAIQANLNTLIFALDHLTERGVFVIEDIPKRTLDAWIPVMEILKNKKDKKKDFGIIQCKKAYVFWMKNNAL